MLEVQTSLGDATADVTSALDHWDNKFSKLWAKDKSLWTGADEDKWLGWLDIVSREQADLPSLQAFAQSVKGLSNVVLIGMGGSSLGSEVLAQSFGRQAGWPDFHTIDSTSPDQIGALEEKLDLEHTLFIVASKSGSTLEPNILKDYFYARVKEHVGEAKTGSHFAAITDPGSSMEKEAKQKGFAHIFYGEPTIGGRYSVLSRFGLVVAAAMGIDLARLLNAASEMVTRCKSAEPLDANPGAVLGLALGVLATKHGRDKITISASPALASVGGWLEQLIAESTGKIGKGLIPVDLEPLAAPSFYGKDRIFVHVSLAGNAEPAALAVLEQAKQPIIRIVLQDRYELGQLFFLSEIAVAVAGAVLGINPFDQPDVEASKIKSRELTDAYEKSGKLPAGEPARRFVGMSLYADARNAKALEGCNALADCLRVHFHQAGAGDYIGLLGFFEQSKAHVALLQTMRTKLRDVLKLATCAEFGPRFLHSTGQAYKGGPNSGVFLTISAEPVRDLDIPGRKISFGVVQQAQAIGDFAVLNERGRRAIRLHLDDLESGLKILAMALDKALA
ncbi:MAG TPA: bifunctional transaldolase/phosoglucose isomerase [Rhizomicrobium sp.]|jgi:transaldolase/glucose-6-phosphate isomerase